MKKSQGDKRMKDVEIMPLGMEAIIDGDIKANEYINDILLLGHDDEADNIMKAFKEFRILALKSNLMKNGSRVTLERVEANYKTSNKSVY